MTEYWVLPCNVKYYDIVAHFQTHDSVVWVKRKNINKDDIVYIYLAAPFGEIKYKCLVTDSNVPLEEVQENDDYALVTNEYGYLKDYMRLEMIEEYPDGKYKRNDLSKHGLGQVQMVARADRKLKEYLNSGKKNNEE